VATLNARDTLPERLGYQFHDPALLRLALTHPSAQSAPSGGDYQRLEFLGDRVLGLVVAESLYKTCPQDSEGALARRDNELVHREACAEVARSLGLGRDVRLSDAEAASGGAGKAAILADVCESVIGAVFLDGGYEAARALIHRLWGARLSEPGAVPIDPKTALQEWAQGKNIMKSAAPAPIMLRSSSSRRACRAMSRGVVRARASARPRRRLPRASWYAKGSGRRAKVSESHEAKTPPVTGASGTFCGFAAIIGAPNAGKSTLTNQLVGAKVAIVTHKVQTTRARLRGILVEGNTQIILVDTPGIFRPKRRLDRAMVDTAWIEALEADVVLLLVDAQKGVDEEVDAILARLAGISRPTALVLNKIDRVRKDRLLQLAAEMSARVNFAQVFMISALNGDGVADLRDWLAEAMPPGPWLYPEDQIADAPMRVMAAEVTREKLYLRLHDELPYASTVETADFKTLKDGSVRIEQIIYVERSSQKKIVLGANGRTIKQISMEAREELSQQFGAPVHLFLFVKVRERWAEDPSLYHAMGLEFPKR